LLAPGRAADSAAGPWRTEMLPVDYDYAFALAVAADGHDPRPADGSRAAFAALLGQLDGQADALGRLERAGVAGVAPLLVEINRTRAAVVRCLGQAGTIH